MRVQINIRTRIGLSSIASQLVPGCDHIPIAYCVPPLGDPLLLPLGAFVPVLEPVPPVPPVLGPVPPLAFVP
jgi:hypothetical protein